MRKLALFGVLLLGSLAVLSSPPAHAQNRCGNNAQCIGSKTSDVRVVGNLLASSPDGGLTIAGGTGSISLPSGTVTVATLDAGVARFNGTVQLTAPFNCAADGICGTVALSSGSPSTATKTVLAGSTCVCWPVGNSAAIAAGGCAASVSSTTATFTGPNTVTTTVAWMCFK